MNERKVEEEKEALEHLNSLSDKFQKLEADAEQVYKQGEAYLKDAKEFDDKRFKSWVGTFSAFLR